MPVKGAYRMHLHARKLGSAAPCYALVVDALRANDVERARQTPPDVRLAQALEAMRLGISLKRDALKARHPDDSADAIDERLRDWLRTEDG